MFELTAFVIIITRFYFNMKDFHSEAISMFVFGGMVHFDWHGGGSKYPVKLVDGRLLQTPTNLNCGNIIKPRRRSTKATGESSQRISGPLRAFSMDASR